jgi:signal peptidase I
MIPWIILAALIAIYSITLPVLLKRAGLNAAMGYIPLINFFPFLKLIKRPWWWFLLLLCPGVNLLMLIVMNVELGIAFGKRSMKDQWIFGALPWYALPQLAFKEKEVAYVGPRDWTGKKKSVQREWGEAIVFAVVAASVIRTFFIEAFTIPTPSMEKTMLVGDYLFVSKMSYGPKIPQTPMSVPFVHNAMPGSMANSYVDWFSLPYFRLPGFGDVERMDPVVFNFPNGDTIMVDPFYAGHDYYSYVRKEAMFLAGGYDNYKTNPEKFNQLARKNFAEKHICKACASEQKARSVQIEGVRYRPMDKKENYVKRCVGLPGDNLSIKNRQLMINGEAIPDPEGVMYSYLIATKSSTTLDKIYDEFKTNMNDRNRGVINGMPATISSFKASEIEKMKTWSDVIAIEPQIDSIPKESLAYYPNVDMAPFNTWTIDNFGPIHIPAKGEKIDLTPENIALYKRVITSYENNTWEEKNGAIYINGQAATTYEFKQDYYWMMGDNRHQSADSRYWGFVPEDHIVGKPVFTWFSKAGNPQYHDHSGIRWNRMFRTVK